LIVGVNLGKKISSTQNNTQETRVTNPTLKPTPSSTPTVLIHTNTYCGLTSTYPNSFVLTESSQNSATFQTTDNTTIAFTCQKDIPRPALPSEKINTITVASVSAKLYHDASPKDGTPIDIVLFRHPTNGMDIYVAGFRDSLESFLQTLTIIK